MPATVTITAEPSSSVVARCGDDLAHSLLTHAGFALTDDMNGPRYRLPTSMSREEHTASTSHAAQMLRAARYIVDLDPALDTALSARNAAVLGDQVLAVTDMVRGAKSGAELADVLDQLLDPEFGVLERVREALESAGEQLTDLDDEAYQLADRLEVASEFIAAAQGELIGVDEEMVRVAARPKESAVTPSAAVDDARSAALASSPAAAKTPPSTKASTPVATAPVDPRASASRTR